MVDNNQDHAAKYDKGTVCSNSSMVDNNVDGIMNGTEGIAFKFLYGR